MSRFAREPWFPARRGLRRASWFRAARRGSTPRVGGVQSSAGADSRSALVGDTSFMTVSLGMPSAPAPVLAPRRKTRKIKVGKVEVGGDAPISVQSMCTTPTTDINATLQQIAELTASGCDIVRVACPSQDDADALPAIARKSQIPVIADIHFQPKYVYAAIEAGCAAVRVNRQHPPVRRPGEADRQGGQGGRRLHPHRRQRRVARQAAAGEVRQAHRRGSGGVGGVGRACSRSTTSTTSRSR